jgi:hypothetical protein
VNGARKLARPYEISCVLFPGAATILKTNYHFPGLKASESQHAAEIVTTSFLRDDQMKDGYDL